MQDEVRNPYATPKAVVAERGAAPDAEAVREEHIVHEASVRSAGLLFILGGLGVLVAGVSLAVPSLRVVAERPGFLVIGVAVAVLGIAYVAVGWGLRGLRQWARKPAIGLATIGLLGFPIGTLINAYILWLVASGKGRTVFSLEYADIIKATPHVRHRTSPVVWVVLALIVLAIVALML